MFLEIESYEYNFTFTCCSIPCISLSGQFVFDLMDTYGGGLGVLWVAIFETAIIMWVYGVNRFSDDLRFMLSTKTSYVWRICWVATPVILMAIFVIACYHWSAPTYFISGKVVHYSDWAHGIGCFLTVLVSNMS